MTCGMQGGVMLLATRSMLEDIVCDLFNGLTGVRARACGESQPGPAGHSLLASVGLRGAVDGVVSVAAPFDLCAELAAERLGADARRGETDNLATSTLGEIVSMAAGCVATLLEPVELTWLTPPAVSDSSPDEWGVMRGARDTAVLEVGGRQVLVTADVMGR